MITDIADDRLIVTSDLHLGSHFSNPQREFLRFVEFACRGGYNICINGDGIDIIHTSLDRFVRETSQLLQQVRAIIPASTRVYYVIGNHDVVLEHYLHDWGMLRLVPFLNVRSGDARIRIEHGHLYDSFFMKNQERHEALTRVLGFFMKYYPPFYTWIKYVRLLRYRRHELPIVGRWFAPPADDGLRIPGQSPAFIRAADELARRGFDVVMFGHTHMPGVFALSGNRRYINTGSWPSGPHYATIENGYVTLHEWRARRDTAPNLGGPPARPPALRS